MMKSGAGLANPLGMNIQSARLVSVGAFLLAASAAACYSPTFREGLPCTVDRECPDSQVCALDDRCYSADPNISTETSLSALEVSIGELVPPFDPAITSYRIRVGLSAADVEVTATPSNAAATLSLDGTAIVAGESSPAVALNLGKNQLTVGVRAESGEMAAYEIELDRGAGILQTAYAKASNAEPSDNFGSGVAISGNTLVVGAHLEDSPGTGPGAGQGNGTDGSGAVYVFTKIGSSWIQQAYLKASNTDVDDFFGERVDIDGDTIVVGAKFEAGGCLRVCPQWHCLDPTGLSEGLEHRSRRPLRFQCCRVWRHNRRWRSV